MKVMEAKEKWRKGGGEDKVNYLKIIPGPQVFIQYQGCVTKIKCVGRLVVEVAGILSVL